MTKHVLLAATTLGFLVAVTGCDRDGEENPPPVSTSVAGNPAPLASAAVVTDAKVSGSPTGQVPTHGSPEDMGHAATPPPAPTLPDGHPALPSPSAAPATPPQGGAMAPPAALGSSVMPTPQAGDLVWKLPANWTETGPTGMRAATLMPPGGPECTVFKFGGVAGGLLSNVNRWRGQVGLEPLTDGGLASQLEERKLGGTATSALVCDMTGPKGRVIGAIVVGAEGTWFFKLQSPEPSKIEAVKPGFIAVVDSLSFQK